MPDSDPDMDAVLEAANKEQSGDDPDMTAVLQQQAAPQPSWADVNINRPLGLATRAAVTGIAGLPMMAMDAGVAGRNLISAGLNKLGIPQAVVGHPARSDYEMPSAMLQQSMDELGLPKPKGLLESGISLAESGLVGAAMPGPTSGIDVPANFVSPEEAAQAAKLEPVKAAMKEGYVVPPSTTNPTLANQALESVSGKIATEQAASSKNQSITNALAKRALGIDANTPLTQDALEGIRSEAAKNYQAIGAAGTINMDDVFKSDIQNIVGKFNKTAEEVPSLANKDLEPVAKDLLAKGQFSAEGLLGAIRGLRNKADMAFRSGDGGSGSAYRQMASSIEGAIDRDVSSRGEEYSGLVNAFRDARQKIAMAHTIEDAFNPATGNVVAPKLAAALKRGEPLSGDLQTIANFAAAVPRAVKEPVHSMGVSYTDAVWPAASALFGHTWPEKVMGAVVPAARYGTRAYLMGPGQAEALPSLAGPATEAPGLLRGLPAGYESLSALLNQPKADQNER